MDVKLLDTIVLEDDLSEYGLKKGDVGAVVEVCKPDGLEVEFVTGSGKTQALVTLKTTEVRKVRDSEILSVRPLDAAW